MQDLKLLNNEYRELVMDKRGLQILNKIQSGNGFKQPKPTMEDNTNPRALSSIDDIFTRLKAICAVGNAFKDDRQEMIVKQEWMLALKQESITRQDMIDDGLERIRTKARKSRGVVWFPSIGEFIDACLGSDDALPMAQKALDLFNSGQKQIETVGREVVKKHGFDLKLMKAADSNKKFIELYLMIAADNPIEPLESHLLTESVQLTKEQQKDAENRAAVARDSFLNQFSSLITEKPKKEVKQSQAGLKTESLKVRHKSQKEIDESRRLQLQQIKGKLK